MLLNCKSVLSLFVLLLASDAEMIEVHDDVVLLQTTLEHSDRRGENGGGQGDGDGGRGDGTVAANLQLEEHADPKSREAADWDTKDYSYEIRAWLEQNPVLSSAPSTAIPRTSEAEASLVWRALLEEQPAIAFNKSHTYHKELQFKLFDRLFQGGPGILMNNAHFDRFSHIMSKENVLRRLGDLQVKQFAFSSILYNYQAYPYVALNVSSALDRSESFLKAEGTRRFMMFNEPVEILPLEGQVEVMDRLEQGFPPLPAYAMPMESFHNIAFIDPIGSSHGLHNHASVWHLQTAGRKAWWVMDPKYTSSVIALDLPDDVLGITPNACAFLSAKTPPEHVVMFIQYEGETVLLPGSYWHSTCALDDYTSAAGGWLNHQCPEVATQDHPVPPCKPWHQMRVGVKPTRGVTA